MEPMLIDDILKVLPQRYPFVMIDRVVELEPGRKVVAVKNVSNNEAYFPGHFPKNPVMPGVLMLEAAAQACIVLFCAGKPCGREKEREFYLGGVKVRFLSPVVPGDQLVITAEPVKVIANAGIMKVRGQANGREVFEGEMSFAAKS